MREISIILGSKSDLDFIKPAEDLLKKLDVEYELKILSAHRTPEKLEEYVKKAESNGIKIIIAAAGGAAALPGVVASFTDLPVIGIPVPTKYLNGIDSLLSILQMPKGIPVATMAIGSQAPINSVLYALKILSLTDKKYREKLNSYYKGEQYYKK